MNVESVQSAPAPRLLDQVRNRIRYKHYSYRTEQAYVYWVRFFVKWHRLRNPRDMGAAEVEAFPAYLANERKVAASTHTQALSALLFLYREVLGVDLPWLKEIGRPKPRQRVPVVLSRGEVKVRLGRMNGVERSLAQLLYGTGMRLMEALRLRIKDVDFELNEIAERDGEGGRGVVSPIDRL
ncbi:phage integrase N-terminal SAM-like domain-containing protein [Pseudothauera rhizosphaerae]|uniref:Integrase n=1 Tax=Pseudothauera rhizosphaerae TaxID=2565932 RepID=A0A4V3WB53_9RHOO|nr:integrase [Pseudothauera rhizosphaerae]